MNNNIWVIAYDKTTGERAEFVCCPQGNASYHAEVFRMKGYDVKILTSEEVDALLEAEK